MSGRCQPLGFTLLEALVGFVILALASAALVQGGTAALAGTGAASRTEQAVAAAQARLAAFSALDAPSAETLEGDDLNGLHWRVTVTPLDSLPLRGPVRRIQERTTLYRVTVNVTWQEGRRSRSVVLQTQRLTPLPVP